MTAIAKVCAWAAALALAPLAAWPQTPPAPAAAPAAGTGEVYANEVDIVARLPGPALWRIATPTSELWILGLAGPIPKRVRFDTRRIEAAMKGAHEFVLPATATFKPSDLITLVIDSGVVHEPGGHTIRSDMPEAWRARFEAASALARQDPKHYDHWRPAIVAVLLAGDAARALAINPQGSQHTIMDIAKAQGVPVRRLATYSAGDLLSQMKGLKPGEGEKCLTLAIAMIEGLETEADGIGKAWEVGDFHAAHAIFAPTSIDLCVPIHRLRERETKAWTQELAKALSRPGKTLAAVDLEELTPPGGLLDQLKAQGLEVSGPAY